MNKKCSSLIIITVLCLNLLTQPSNAFELDKTRTDIIYNTEDEKYGWEKLYLPYAKHLKLIDKTTTVLDLVKATEKDEKNIDLISEIKNRTHQDSAKLIVKWERDNEYIDEELEKDFNITLPIRKRLLAEVSEEEEREKKESNQFWWNTAKAIGSVVTFGVGFIVAGGLRGEIKEAGKQATILATLATTLISVMDVARGWIAKFWTEDLTGHPEIKTIADLIKLPELPKDYKRVNVYRYGL